MSFCKDFVWGAASSAYQIEGGARAGGRGVSIWDTFSHTPGKTFDGQTGDEACDAYHRFGEDIALLARMGAGAYRFSLSWARIDPLGDGNFNPEGFAYYDQVIDACQAAGLAVYLTLFHWDLPQALEDQGGWCSRQTADAFGRYAAACAAHFKGRVACYITLNEIECSAGLGYGKGEHAPGKALPADQVFDCVHHHLLAHGLAARAIRQADPGVPVSIATTGRVCYPATTAPADREAARAEMFAMHEPVWEWAFTHNLVLDPILLGQYPDFSGTPLAAKVAAVPPADLELIHTGLDCICLNLYNGCGVAAGPEGPCYPPRPTGYPMTALKWPITPEAMEWGVRFVWERYGLPIFISENGLSCNDFLALDGHVHDADRIDFLHRYLLALRAAVRAGVPVQGYFQWSLTDNYEWNNGYKERFGLIYVDYVTQRRVPKDSAAWFAQVIRTGGDCL